MYYKGYTARDVLIVDDIGKGNELKFHDTNKECVANSPLGMRFSLQHGFPYFRQ